MGDLIIKMRDVRKAGMCSAGARSFFLLNNLDWQAFLRDGIESDRLLATGDAMAIQVVRIAENGQ